MGGKEGKAGGRGGGVVTGAAKECRPTAFVAAQWSIDSCQGPTCSMRPTKRLCGYFARGLAEKLETGWHDAFLQSSCTPIFRQEAGSNPVAVIGLHSMAQAETLV